MEAVSFVCLLTVIFCSQRAERFEPHDALLRTMMTENAKSKDVVKNKKTKDTVKELSCTTSSNPSYQQPGEAGQSSANEEKIETTVAAYSAQQDQVSTDSDSYEEACAIDQESNDTDEIFISAYEDLSNEHSQSDDGNNDYEDTDEKDNYVEEVYRSNTYIENVKGPDHKPRIININTHTRDIHFNHKSGLRIASINVNPNDPNSKFKSITINASMSGGTVTSDGDFEFGCISNTSS